MGREPDPTAPGPSPVPPTGPSPKPPADAAAGAAPPDEIIYHGRVSLWIAWRALAGASAAALLGLAFWAWGQYQESGGWARFTGTYLGLPLFLAGLLMGLYVWLRVRSIRYKITSRLVERETGILTRRVDSLDLARVQDVQLVQTLLQRFVGVGTVELYSSDRTDPCMFLEYLPGARAIYDKLRDASIRITQRRGFMPLDH